LKDEEKQRKEEPAFKSIEDIGEAEVEMISDLVPHLLGLPHNRPHKRISVDYEERRASCTSALNGQAMPTTPRTSASSGSRRVRL